MPMNLLAQGSQAGAGVPFDQRVAHPAPVNEHALLNEFKMAAQSLIEVWSEGESVDYPEELQRHVDWFKELLA
jgi:hypothetical protein